MREEALIHKRYARALSVERFVRSVTTSGLAATIGKSNRTR